MKNTVLAVLAVTLLAVSGVGQTPDWTEITTASSPSARYSHAMAYDSVRGKTVMFGGVFSFAIPLSLSDTWEYDGVNWTQVTPANSPSYRNGHAMVYDSARGRLVMFGGGVYGFPYRNDTWEYDGVNWTQVTTASSPSVRRDHAMAYDSVRGKVVMFGGSSTSGLLNDTWEYDGVNWTQVTTASSPSARYSHAMVYDSARGKVVVFGGNFHNIGFGYLNDTWEYDGVNWTQVTTASWPFARADHAMAYDSVRGKSVTYGGIGANPSLQDTWEFDGLNWTQVTAASSPSVRQNYAMVYDSARLQVVMFGGLHGIFNNDLNDTWEYDGQLAGYPSDATTYGMGCGSPALALSPLGNPIVATTAGALITNAPTPIVGVSLGQYNLAFELSNIGMPGCLLLQSNEVFGLPVTPVSASTFQFDAAIPSSPALIGQHFYIQAYCFAPGVNAAQIVTSNGIEWVIGNQ
jgi:hypothetical protein